MIDPSVVMMFTKFFISVKDIYIIFGVTDK